MIVGIHPDKKHGKLGLNSKKLKKILDINHIKNSVLNVEDDLFWEKIRKCDLFIFRWNQYDFLRQIAKAILPIIENELKVRCFPNSLSSWIYDDKIREYYLLRQYRLPIIKTWVFYDPSNAYKFVDSARYPLIFKLSSGAGSNTVKMIKNKRIAKRHIELMFKKGVDYNRGVPGSNYDYCKRNGLFNLVGRKIGTIKGRLKEGKSYYSRNWYVHKNYIMFQKFMPNNTYDTRVVIIGKQAFAFQRQNRKNDFRASGSATYIYTPSNIDLHFIETAFRINKLFRFEVMAYDFLYDENKKPVIAELSYAFGSHQGSKLSLCPGYWDQNLQWHEDKIDVSHCIISNILDVEDLKRN